MVADTLLRWGVQSTSGRKLRVAAGDATTGANAGDTTGAAGTGRKLHAAAPAPAVTDFRTPSVGSNTGAGRKLQDASVGGTTAGASGRKLQDASVGGTTAGVSGRKLQDASVGGTTAGVSGRKLQDASVGGESAGVSGRKLQDASVGGESAGVSGRKLRDASVGGTTAGVSGRKLRDASVGGTTAGVSGRKLQDASVGGTTAGVSGRKLQDASVGGTTAGVSGRKLQDAENVGGEGVGRNIPNRRLHQADLGAEGSTAASSTVNGGLPIVSPSSRTAMAPTNMNTGRKLLDAAVVGGEGVGFNIPNRRLQQADLGAEGSTAASSTSNGGLPMVSPSSQTAMAPSTNMNSGRKLLDASVSDSSTVPGAGFVSGRNVLDAAVSDTSSGACTAIG